MKLIVSSFFTLTIFIGFAQSLEKFTYLNDLYGANEIYVGINPTYSFIRNKKAPFPMRHSLTGFTGDVSIRKVNFDQGSLSWNWQNKMYADVFLLLGDVLGVKKSKTLYTEEQTGLTCGIIGWADFTWAINKPNGQFQWSLGINFHDYFYGSAYAVDSSANTQWITSDPQGYYFAAGPTLKINYLINPVFMIEMSNSYSISYWKALDLSDAATLDSNYPLPHWGQIDFEIQSKWGLFTGFNYNWIINRGVNPNAGTRFDLIFGFRFVT